MNKALLITNPYNIHYLSGFPSINPEERESYLLLVKNEKFILTDSRYLEYAQEMSSYKALEITPRKSLNYYLKKILDHHKVKKLTVETNDLKHEEFLKLKKSLKIKLVPAKEIIEKKRQIKTKKEIEAIKKAAKISDYALEYIKSKIKEGITEKELADSIEKIIKKYGASPAFPPIVAFDKNSSIPHYRTGDKKLKVGHSLLLDFGARVDNYCSDITRVFFFKKCNPKQKNIYDAVLKAQEKTINALKNTESAKEIDKIAKAEILKAGFLPYRHSTGHGVGLQIHEKPKLNAKSKDLLKKGMVFSIEPGIYIPEFGGIRIEDLVYISENGPEVLSKASKKITVIG